MRGFSKGKTILVGLIMLIVGILVLAGCSAATPTTIAPTATPINIDLITPTLAVIFTPIAITTPTPHANFPPEATPTSFPIMPANAKPCTADDLKISMGDVNGALGRVFVAYYLTNKGSIFCTLQGYPELQVLDRDGNTIPDQIIVKDDNPIGIDPNVTADITVGLHPGDSALLNIIFSTCSLGSVPDNLSLYLNLPAGQGSIFVSSGSRRCQPTGGIEVGFFMYPT